MYSISKLKEMIIGPSDLSKTLDYFLKITENNESMINGSPLSDNQIKSNEELQVLEPCVEHVLQKFLKEKVSVIQMMLSSVPNENLFHGVCLVNTATTPIPLTIIYFSDIKKGMLALFKFGKNTDCFRFALATSPDLAANTTVTDTMH